MCSGGDEKKKNCTKSKNAGLGSGDRNYIVALLLTACMTESELLLLSGPRLPPPQNEWVEPNGQ